MPTFFVKRLNRVDHTPHCSVWDSPGALTRREMCHLPARRWRASRGLTCGRTRTSRLAKG